MGHQLICAENCEPIIRKYSDMLFQLTYAKTRNFEHAEDVVQETFIKLIKANKTFESEEHIKAWLIRVAINGCKSLWSSAWFSRTVEYKEEASMIIPMEEKSEVYYAILELPEKYRVVIHLYYYEDMSVREIAEILKMKEASVETRIHRVRGLLRNKLKGDYDYV